jgi:DNA-binding response OmpR family regulator
MIPTASPLAGLRVLVVEDDYFVAEEMRRALEARGATVLGPVAKVAAARPVLAGVDHIGLAMLDINLQDEMVFDLADELIARNILVVFLTGYDRHSLPSRYAAIRVFEKPVEVALVAEALLT